MIYFFYITIMCGPDLSTDIENKFYMVGIIQSLTVSSDTRKISIAVNYDH